MVSDLRTINVTKRFGGITALNSVNIRVEPDSIVMLIGPNGSGKTTLINVIAGYYKPDKGRVLFNGFDITGWLPHEIFKTGIVRTFQIPKPFKKLSVLDNLLLAVRSNPGESIINALFRAEKWKEKEREALQKAYDVLELLDLERVKHKKAAELSGGQLKLLEIGRALMAEPKLILMDEPVAGVNPSLAHEIMDHIVSLRNTLRLSFLIVEHRLDIVLDYVDKVYAMSHGKVISVGKPSRVISDPQVVEAYLGG